MTRDQKWLENLFNRVYREYFQDVRVRVPLRVEWGRRAKTRLGSLSYDPKRQQAVVRLTRLFQSSDIPVFVVEGTIVHELCHYAHGFHAGRRPRYRHPHRGGVIKQEFAERGLGELYVAQSDWLRHNWPKIIKKPTNRGEIN